MPSTPDTDFSVLPALVSSSGQLGRPNWRPMLRYVARLHERCIRGDRLGVFPHPWEEIGPGYVFRPVFGHWDIVHAGLDAVADEPAHVARQMENLFALQDENGRLPVMMAERSGRATFHDPRLTHPPVWPVLIDELLTHGVDLRNAGLIVAKRQLDWFDTNRRAAQGYAYADLMIPGSFESGIDDGIRFRGDDPPRDRWVPFIDACCHVWLLLDAIARWGDDAGARGRADQLAAYVREAMWSERSGFFHDPHQIKARRELPAFEGIWPVVVGIATDAQAHRVIDRWLLDPSKLGAPHPIRTVASGADGYDMRMWRGPAWNSMTLWACRGCLGYGRSDAAAALAGAALDMSARHFNRHGTVYEFYHPDGLNPQTVSRKPYLTDLPNQPCPDYLGHNPLIALARVGET